MNTQAQTAIYVIAFVACVGISYAIGHEKGQIAGEKTAHKAWVKKEEIQDIRHQIALNDAEMKGICAVVKHVTPVIMQARNYDSNAGWIPVITKCLTFVPAQ